MDGLNEPARTPDFDVVAYESISVLIPMNSAAAEWSEAHLPDRQAAFGGGIAVETAYIKHICLALVTEGFSVAKDGRGMHFDEEGRCL